MKIWFLGVRGSTPAPGADFASVGGNTSCVALAHDGEPPSLVLDAGTGLRRLTRLLDGAPFTGTILLSHLHWDHVQGLPFFAAGDRDDADVRLVMPEQGDAAEVLGRAMSPPHFPIGPDGLRGRWRFEGMAPGAHRVEGFDVVAREIPHKGGRTYGFRVSDATGTIAYLPDHATTGGEDDPRRRDVAELVSGVDLLIHDAQFVDAERAVAEAYGHATISDAACIARAGAVGTLALFHHGPDRTDAQLAELAAEPHPSGVTVMLATEATVLSLPRTPSS